MSASAGSKQHLERRNNVDEDLNTSQLKEINSDGCTSGITMAFEEIVAGIFDDSNRPRQFICTQNASILICRGRCPPINKIVEAKIIPKLVTFLKWDDNQDMQLEAACALDNIASGSSEQICAVVDGGAVPNLIEMLGSHAMNVVQQAVWALGNIAVDGAAMRDYLLDKEIVQPLVKLVTDEVPVSFLQDLTWIIVNPCRDNIPHTAHVTQLLPTIVKLVNCSDKQVRTYACWALGYITDGLNEIIKLVIKTGVVETLVNILQEEQDDLVITPVLRTHGNVVSGTDQQTQLVIDLGVLRHLSRLLYHHKPVIKEAAIWTLSGITAGTQCQIQAVIDANVMARVVELLSNGDYKTQRQACWTVTSFTFAASTEQMVYLMNLGAVQGLCGLLDTEETYVLEICLDGISYLLDTAKIIGKCDEMCDIIYECDGVRKIENLQEHENEIICGVALCIIENFFSGEEEDTDIALASSLANGA